MGAIGTVAVGGTLFSLFLSLWLGLMVAWLRSCGGEGREFWWGWVMRIE